jgi:DNA polymerase III sliding clamp (beta) subunit (PCNA family)
MKIVVNRQDLLTVLKRAGSAIDPNTMLSIQKCVLLVASTTPGTPKLTIGATDGVLGVIQKLDTGEVKEPGQAVLNHRDLTQRIDNMPPGIVEITIDAQYKVSIRSSASKRKFAMTGLDPSEFPPLLKERPNETLYSVEAKILQQSASETRFALSTDMCRGMLLVPGDDKLFQLIGLGRYAFAVATGWFTERNGGASATECLLPLNLLEAVDALPKETICAISMDDKKISVSTPDTLIFASQLQTQMPDVWRQILRSAPVQKRFKVSSEAFLSSVKAVSVAADFVEGAEKFVQIDLVAKEGEVTIRTKKSERSQGEDELAVEDAAPGSFDFHVDAGILSAALRAFSPTDLDLYFDVIGGQEALVLKNETLFAMLQLIAVIPSPPPKEKK